MEICSTVWLIRSILRLDFTIDISIIILRTIYYI